MDGIAQACLSKHVRVQQGIGKQRGSVRQWGPVHYQCRRCWLQYSFWPAFPQCGHNSSTKRRCAALNAIIGTLVLAGHAGSSTPIVRVVQSVHDSCRLISQIQFRKQAGLPLELTDEMNYKCGDGVTAVEVQYTAGLRAVEPANILNTLLAPAVVSHCPCALPAASFHSLRQYELTFRCLCRYPRGSVQTGQRVQIRSYASCWPTCTQSRS